MFSSGLHILRDEDAPFNLEQKQVFHCKIYFINKKEQVAVKWGTTSEIKYMEPFYNFPISIGVSGEMSLYPDN